ncbi:MAG: InlB B-repeat-containing protein, partial [Candidatus Bathyarchaeota archaeon]|nr:InlB B-repeat-containing protein [Candidatus Termiticorpusculum sp.]
MKKTNKLLIISIICTTLILSNLPQLTSAEEEPNPNITPLLNQLYTTNLTVTIDTTNPNIINVSGHQSGVSTPLTLTIPESITVRWGATYTSSTTFSGSLINFTGDGTFEVGPGGYLWHMGSGTAINAAGHYVIVSGTNSANSGTIQASTGSAITGSGTNTVITIDGGSVCGDETHNINPVINMNNPENTDKNVIVNNGAIWAMSEDRLAYAIQTYGNIEVNDGEISTRGENGRAINLVGSTSVAYINGGKIWATGISGVAISTATTPGINVDNAGVIITGGVISATSNYAIHVTGAHSFVDVKGGIVNATTGCAIYGERGATVTVSNGFVFAYGTTILGTNNVLHIVGGTPQITSTGVVVAWNNAKYPGPFSVHEQTGLTISPNSATVEWYKKENSKDGISYQNGINANYFPIDGVTVYGLVNVTFNANTNDDDSVLPSMPNKIVTFGSSYGLLATVERHGYNFIGWFTETDTLITESTIVKNTADHTLYAHWSAIDDIVVIFDANAGGDESVVLSEQFMVVTFGEVYGSLVLVDRVGYDFVGWFTDGVGGVEVVDSTLVSNVDSHVLYAHWTA